MRHLGNVTKGQLQELQRRGYTPDKAHAAIIDEAKRRFGVEHVVMSKRTEDSWDIISLP